MDFDQFKQKMANDEQARADFMADVHSALKKQGVNVSDATVMKKFGLDAKNLKNWQNFASSAIITITQ